MTVPPEEITTIIDSTTADKCYFLESPQGKNEIFPLEANEGIRRTAVNAIFEGDGAPVLIHHLLKTYCYLDNRLEDGIIVEKYLDIIREYFSTLDLYEVRAPKANIRQLITNHIS